MRNYSTLRTDADLSKLARLVNNTLVMDASRHTSHVTGLSRSVQALASDDTERSVKDASGKPAVVRARYTLRRSRRGRLGAVAVEYAFLLVAVAVPISMAISAGGFAMLRQYLLARNMILEPDP